MRIGRSKREGGEGGDASGGAGPAVRILVDGVAVDARVGQSVGAAMWAAGIRTFRTTRIDGRPRALYCGIGQCFDCLVTVDGAPAVRACITPVVDGQQVGTA